MDKPTLESRIEAWPDQWKVARVRYTEANAALAAARLEVDRLEQLDQLANDAEEGAAPDPTADALGESQALLDLERQQLEIDHMVQLASFDVERTKAAIDIAVRSEAFDSGQKITESAVESRVKTDPAYVEAQKRLIEAKHDQAIAKLNKTQQQRVEREEYSVRRAALYASSQQDDAEEPVASPELAQARIAMMAVVAAQIEARTELRYQERVGRSLRMLTDLIQGGAD